MENKENVSGSKMTMDDIRKLDKPTEGFLCSAQANIYDLEFVHFKIRNAQTNSVLFEVTKPESEYGKFNLDAPRTVKYQFGPQFFNLGVIGTTLEFRVGAKPIKKFVIIERHYFKGKLIKSFEFDVPFCIPGTKNSLEAMYELPQFDPDLKADMIASPFATKADSFYFAEGQLIMHNKAEFSYAPFK